MPIRTHRVIDENRNTIQGNESDEMLYRFTPRLEVQILGSSVEPINFIEPQFEYSAGIDSCDVPFIRLAGISTEINPHINIGNAEKTTITIKEVKYKIVFKKGLPQLEVFSVKSNVKKEEKIII